MISCVNFQPIIRLSLFIDCWPVVISCLRFITLLKYLFKWILYRELMATVVNSNKIVISVYNTCILEDKCLSKCNGLFPKIHDKKKLLMQESHSLNWKLKISKYVLCFVLPYGFVYRFYVLLSVFVIKYNYFHFYNLRFPKRKVVEF